MTEGPVPGTYRRTSGTAIASLVFGIVGIVVLPIVGGIVAIVLGRSAQREIAADPNLSGQGYAQAGVVLGWISIVLVVIVLLFFAFGVGTGGSGEGDIVTP